MYNNTAPVNSLNIPLDDQSGVLSVDVEDEEVILSKSAKAAQ